MPAVETRYEHIVLDERQVPFIAGTTMKVIELLLESMAYGWSAEELHLNHPYLSLGQIHSALAYYWDHQTDFDKQIEEQLEHVDTQRARHQPRSLIARLKART